MSSAVEELRCRGVRFEDYDLSEVKTVGGISATGDLREAWFRDPDGNGWFVQQVTTRLPSRFHQACGRSPAC